MTDIFTTPISAYKNVTDTTPATVTLRQFLFSKKHQSQIIALRAEGEKKRRDELKKRLPAATISGTFTKRAVAHIEQYNGLVCLDFDAADNPGRTPADMKTILSAFDEVAYAAVSVGGAGTFAIIPTTNTDPTAHASVVDLLGAVLATHGLSYDRSCKDISRLRIVSYDPEAYINPNAYPFDADRLRRIIKAVHEEESTRPPRPLIIRQRVPPPIGGGAGGGVDRTRERVEALISAVEHSRTDLTGHYDDWIKLGFAIASHFGMDGEDYYQRLSQFHEKYDHQETAKKYADFVRNGRRIRIGTFFKILENKGFSL